MTRFAAALLVGLAGVCVPYARTLAAPFPGQGDSTTRSASITLIPYLD